MNTSALAHSTAPATIDSDSAGDAARHRRLVDASQQFEAMFLQQMLKSGAPDGEAASKGDDESGAADTYKDFGTEAVAKAIAQAGGLGVARQIVAQVEHVANRPNVNRKTFDSSLKPAP